MLLAKIRLMDRMVPSDIKDQILEELKAEIEAHGTTEEKACFYEVHAGILQEMEEFAWWKVLESMKSKRLFFKKNPSKDFAIYSHFKEERIEVLRKWANHAQGESRLLAWGNLMAILDVKEDREELSEVWVQAKAEVMELPEEKRQEILRLWLKQLVDHETDDDASQVVTSKHLNNSVRLNRLYPLEPTMDGPTRHLFYRSMVQAYDFEGEDLVAVDWALKGMARLGAVLEADDLFLYLESVNQTVGLVDGRETECAKLVRCQWNLARDLDAYGSGVKLSMVLMNLALDDGREMEANQQWDYLEGTIQKYGISKLFSGREKDLKRWLDRLKRRLDQVNRSS